MCCLSLLCLFSITSAALIPYEVSGTVSYDQGSTTGTTTITKYYSGSGMISDVPHVNYDVDQTIDNFQFALSQFDVYVDNVQVCDNASGSMSFILNSYNDIWGVGFNLGSIWGTETWGGPVGNWTDLNNAGIPVLPEQLTWAIQYVPGMSGGGPLTLTRSVPEPSVFPLFLAGFLSCCVLFRKKKEASR